MENPLLEIYEYTYILVCVVRRAVELELNGRRSVHDGQWLGSFSRYLDPKSDNRRLLNCYRRRHRRCRHRLLRSGGGCTKHGINRPIRHFRPEKT